MSRTVTWSFAALALFLVTFPLALAKPGLPLTLKSDEPAYYLMALSLAHDRDLVCELRDVQRLAVEFPYNTTRNLILASSDGWQTVYFGKPFLVSLVAAPAVALFGADGFVATNMAMLLAAIWLGALYLRRFNPDGVALLFSAGFFLLSNAFAYVFWLHTETLCVFSVAASLYLAFTPGGEAPPAGYRGPLRRALARVWNPATRPLFSGAVLLAGVYNKPYLAAFALPILVAATRRDGWRGALRWLGGGALAAALVAGLSMLLVGQPTSYLGWERQGVEVDRFDAMPELPEPTPADPVTGPRNSFEWIFRSFRGDAQLGANALYFLVGRHTGLFPYAPFTLLSLGLFFAFSRRSAERWALLAALGAIALYLLTFLWFNWHGGGGFVGNRYYVNALPGFLFLVTRIAPAWLPALGYALAGLFVGGIVFTPFGAVVPSPTLQAHVRNAPFALLPFERTLSRQIPGYQGVPGGAGAWIFGRNDQFRPLGESLWIVGGQRVELELRAPAPLERPVFEVATRIAPNRIALALDGARQRVELAAAEPPGNTTRIVLEPGPGRLVRHPEGYDYRSYRLVVDAERQLWHHEVVRFRESKKGRSAGRTVEEGVAVPDFEANELDLLVGAVVTYLGEQSELEADAYAARWLEVRVPPRLPAGRIAAFGVRLRNSSDATWRAQGGTAVRLAYHWLTPEGERVVWEGMRTPLPRDVEPGQMVEVVLEVETPRAPGSYRLVIDPVRERLAWFSEKRPQSAWSGTVEVVPPGR
jgi:hypothetical protein